MLKKNDYDFLTELYSYLNGAEVIEADKSILSKRVKAVGNNPIDTLISDHFRELKENLRKSELMAKKILKQYGI